VKIGTLYGISVGPGDPELITQRTAIAPTRGSMLPAGVQGKPGIAQQIVVNGCIQTSATGFDFPLRARYGSANSSWQVAAQQVWQYLRQGQDVFCL